MNKRTYLYVTGPSMIPFLCNNALVNIERTNFNDVSAGDIIVFSRDGKSIIHRVLGKDTKNRLLTTKGDNLNHVDPFKVNEKELLGRVVEVDGKKISGMWFRNYLSFSISIIRFLAGKYIQPMTDFFRFGWPKIDDISVEDKLLYKVCQPGHCTNIPKPMKTDFVNTAKMSGLGGIAYRRLTDDSKADFKSDYLSNIYNNTLYLNELDLIAKEFKKHKVDLMALKGLALLESLYSDIGLRRISDIDIMVREKELNKAHELLVDLGYRLSERHDPSYWRKYHYHLLYLNENKKICLDLHWNLIFERGPFKVDADDIWKNKRSAKGHYAPGINEMILHLCIHISNPHAPYGGGISKYLCDLDYLIEKEEINFPEIIKKAKRWKICSLVYNSFLLHNFYFENKIEAKYLKMLWEGVSGKERWLLNIVNRHIIGRKPISGHKMLLLDFFWAGNTDRPWVVRKAAYCFWSKSVKSRFFHKNNT
ncbi:MAG: nucleotidyltransferase family protein [archaeon]